MEKKTLSILLFEDSPTDHLVLCEYLDRDSLAAFELTITPYLADGLNLLRQARYDAILLDLGLPDSFGLETFEKVHLAAPHMPIIVISGQNDETIALQAVQLGAQDYLLKGPSGWSIAARSIRYAIERQRVQAALSESETRFSTAFFTNPVAQSIFDPQKNVVLFANDACCRMFGYSHEELIGANPALLNLWETPEDARAAEEEILRTGHMSAREIHLRAKSGELRSVIAAIEPLLWQGTTCFLSITYDITARKQAEQQLRESETLLRQVLESSQDGIFAIDKDYHLLINNRRHQQALIASGSHALTPGESVFPSEYPPEILEKWRAAYDRALAGEDLRLENNWNDRKGHQHMGESNLSPLRNAEGAIRGVRVVSRDVTEVKQAEQALRESEARFSLAFQSSATPQAITIRGSGKILAVNQAFCQLFGYPREELIGASALTMGIWEDPNERQSVMDELNETGRVHARETNVYTRSGSVLCLIASLELITWQGLPCLISSMVDITARKAAENALRESEERYRRLADELDLRVQERSAQARELYENAPAGYHSLDSEGRFVMINQTELDWLGYERNELLGKPFHVVLSEESRAGFEPGSPSFANREPKYGVEADYLRKDGSTFPVTINSTSVQDEHGAFIMSRATVTDSTLHKTAERNLRQSRDELRAAYADIERAARAKDEFLANMSHELRTPLNGILGSAEILLDELRGPINDHQRQLISVIDSSGQHLLSLINDILDLSKIESGHLDIYKEQVSIAMICQASMAFIKEPAFKKGVTVGFFADPSVTVFQADPRRMKQILVNLLSNAVKFTPAHGRVTLHVQANPIDSCVEFHVTDNGVGIAPMDLARLFQPFTQVDSSLTRQHEGTGLGLALVKRLTEMHGGSVRVDSTPGKGSRFTVALPWQPEDGHALIIPAETDRPMAASPAIVRPVSSRSTLLLAEDNLVNRQTIGNYLEAHGYGLLYASNGREAIEMAEAASPDLILMDIQMPVMDGIQAIRKLRANQRFATTPIVALTALAMRGDSERILDSGATSYLSKPVRLKQLIQMIDELLSQDNLEIS